MKKNIKNVAYIQDFNILSDEQIKKYMGDIKYLTAADVLIIYKFIVCCNKCYKITNFCLSVNSETLKNLNILIQNNRKLDNCIFVATRSNANSVRDVIAKNIYFSLSSINVIIKDYLNIEPYNIMTIVSDERTPYYDQIYETGPKPAYRISELTVKKVNDFVDKGSALNLLITLNNFPINEYEKLNEIFLDPECKYKNFATFIEVDTRDIPFIDKLNTKLVSINNIASNVCIAGLTASYPDINIFTLYNNCAIQIVKNYYSWSNFIKSSILFNRFTEKNNKLKNKIGYTQVLSSIPIPIEAASELLSTIKKIDVLFTE